MGVLYLTSESDPAEEDIERVAGVARTSEECDSYSIAVTNELLTNGWGTLAVSPGSYEALNNQDRFTIQSLVARQARCSACEPSYRQPSRMKRRWRRQGGPVIGLGLWAAHSRSARCRGTSLRLAEVRHKHVLDKSGTVDYIMT